MLIFDCKILCLRTFDAMSQEFLEHTREHRPVFSQSPAIPSNSSLVVGLSWPGAPMPRLGDVIQSTGWGASRRGVAQGHVAGWQLLARRWAPSRSARRASFSNFDRSKRALGGHIHPDTGAL